MDQLTNDNFVQDIMSEPLIPTQPSLEDAYDDTITAGDYCSTFDQIDDVYLDVNQDELDEILQDDVNFENNTLREAKGNGLSLSVKEITYRLSTDVKKIEDNDISNIA